jgi:DNA-binding MarR family transcriptional regulator
MKPNLTEPQKRIVEVLEQAATPLTVGQVVEATGLGYPWVSRVITQLYKLGLVKKERGMIDTRSVLVSLVQTPAA